MLSYMLLKKIYAGSIIQGKAKGRLPVGTGLEAHFQFYLLQPFSWQWEINYNDLQGDPVISQYSAARFFRSSLRFTS